MNVPAGVREAWELAARVENANQCIAGYHAWVPWLTVRNDDGTVRFYVTWCAREGCDRVEQWDCP